MSEKKKEAALAGCPPTTCPRCALSPENVDESKGQRPAVLLAPGYVNCPICGLVRDQVADPKAKPTPPGCSSRRTDALVQWCWHDEIRRKRNRDAPSSSSSTGKGKDTEPPDRRWEQDQLPFRDRPLMESERLYTKDKMVIVSLSREMEVWIQETAVRHSMSQSDVIRAALQWAIHNNPSVSRVVKSSWPSRRRTTIRIERELWDPLHSEAQSTLGVRVGRFASVIVDYCRRKRVSIL